MSDSITVALGPKLFQFGSFAGWVNRAQRAWKQIGVRSVDTICLDTKGRPCRIGRDFMKARDEETFPVSVYLLRGDLMEYEHLNQTLEVAAMKWLTIDCTKSVASFLVVEDGKRFGNTQLLDHTEVTACARWLGLAGGKRLLDDFEIHLINDGVLRIWPMDEDGDPYLGGWECIDLERHDSEARLWWQRKDECETCCGAGHIAAEGDLVTDEDACYLCDGTGWQWGAQVLTDMDGLLIQPKRVLS